VHYYSCEVQVPITAVNHNNFTSNFEQIYAILDRVRVLRLKIRFSQKKQLKSAVVMCLKNTAFDTPLSVHKPSARSITLKSKKII